MVLKAVKYNDIFIGLMVLFLNLELIACLAFYVYSSKQDWDFRCFNQVALSCHDEFWYETPFVSTDIILSHIFIINAVLINLRNWYYYFIRIGEMAYHAQFESGLDESKLDPYLEKLSKRVAMMTSILNWATFFAVMLFDFFIVAYLVILINYTKKPFAN